MKAILALSAFILAAVQAQADPACVAMYPNTKCHSSAAVDKPIIVSNLECDVCYSSSVIQNMLSEQDFPLTDAHPSSFKELGSGFDFTVDCEAGTVSVYRAISPTTPRCAGNVWKYDNGTCIRLGDSSLRANPGVCNYTLKSGFEDIPQTGSDDICGNWGYTWESTCDECLELWLSTPTRGYNYYMTSCANGTTNIYADSECTEKSNTDPIPMSDCHYYPGDFTQSAHLQVLPVFYEDTRLCRAWYNSSDCSTDLVYLDCGSACGGCYESDTEVFGQPAYGSYTNCDDFSTVFYKDQLCSPYGKLSAPVAFQNCVAFDGRSFRTGTVAEYD